VAFRQRYHAGMMSLQLPDRATLGQLLRFGVTGGGITLASVLGYLALATWFDIRPALAFNIVFVVLTGIGFLLHGRISFRGYGSRDQGGARMARYFAINLAGLGLNQAFIWLLVTQMAGPVWWSTIPMIFVTPLATFLAHRRWVYA
jgi:putative flippase GtrA